MIRLFLNARLRVLTRCVHTGCLDALFLYSFFCDTLVLAIPAWFVLRIRFAFIFNLETSIDISDGVLDVIVEADF